MTSPMRQLRRMNTTPVLGSDTRNNVKVIARFRPLLEFEVEQGNSGIEANYPNSMSVALLHDENYEDYCLDKVFPQEATQAEVYDFVGKSKIEDVMLGYNGTIFAYGQTGSGKTHTMMGNDLVDPMNSGIVPRACAQIFESASSLRANTEVAIKCSILEVYKEQLIDLLNPTQRNMKIKTRNNGIYVEGLSEYYVTSAEELIELVIRGEQSRTVATTNLNKLSSRSHQLFFLTVKQALPDGTEKTGVLNLVDLAGSESVRESGVVGQHLDETRKINLSLSALGNTIHALTSNVEHIPYRDSKLTRLLQESLGGNFQTSLIVACSTNQRHIEETLRSLKFAQRAKKIKNKVKANVVSRKNYAQLVRSLGEELRKAHEEISFLQEGSRSGSVESSPSPCVLRRMNTQTVQSTNISKKRARFLNELGEQCGTFEFEEISENDRGELLSKIKELEDELKESKKDNSKLKGKLSKLLTKHITLEQKNFEHYESYYKTLNILKNRDDQFSYLEKSNGSMQNTIKRLRTYTAKLEKELQFKSPQDLDEGGFRIINPDETSVLDYENLCSDGFIDLPTDTSLLNTHSEYSRRLLASLEKNSEVSTEMSLFNMKNQVIQAGILNSELAALLESTRIKYSLHKIQHEDIKVRNCLYKHRVSDLDNMFDYLHASYSRIVVLYNKRQVLDSRSVAPTFIRPLNKTFKNSYLEHDSSVYVNSQLDLYKFICEGGKENTNLHKQQIKSLKNQIMQLNNKYKHLLKLVRQEFKNYLTYYKLNYENELHRRQCEVEKLNEVLGAWIHSYMELQGQPKSPTRASLHLELQRMHTENRVRTREYPYVLPASLGDYSPSLSSSDGEAPDN